MNSLQCTTCRAARRDQDPDPLASGCRFETNPRKRGTRCRLCQQRNRTCEGSVRPDPPSAAPPAKRKDSARREPKTAEFVSSSDDEAGTATPKSKSLYLSPLLFFFSELLAEPRTAPPSPALGPARLAPVAVPPIEPAPAPDGKCLLWPSNPCRCH